MNTRYREFYPAFNRQGLIIDVRQNCGGNIDSFILDKLMRKAWMYWQGRAGEPTWNMQYAFRGHMVVLVEAETASDGEAFADGFRRLGMGVVIGTRTWGGKMWLSGVNTLSDGGVARAHDGRVRTRGEVADRAARFIPGKSRSPRRIRARRFRTHPADRPHRSASQDRTSLYVRRGAGIQVGRWRGRIGTRAVGGRVGGRHGCHGRHGRNGLVAFGAGEHIASSDTAARRQRHRQQGGDKRQPRREETRESVGQAHP